MIRCDALIVGGGPAGSTCARRLREGGLHVVVLDKARFPRDKTCAGWITPAVVAALGLDTADYARGRVFQPVTGFRTGIIGGRTVETRYPAPVSFGIRRCEFDHYLLERSGAELRLAEKLERLERRDGAWIANGAIAAPVVVGAGGHFCPVARMLGATAGAETVVAAQESEFRLAAPCAVQPGIAELYFCPDLKGYAWCFRKGDVLNLGLGREDTRRLSEHVGAFRAVMERQGRIPADVPSPRGHAYILYGHASRRLIEDGVLLIGDAAGLAYEESGEGIRPAVESALLAAGVILAARRDYGRDRLRPYAEAIRRRFGKPGPRPGASLAPAPLKQWLAAWLLTTPWFTRRVLIDRWFLRTREAALEQ